MESAYFWQQCPGTQAEIVLGTTCPFLTKVKCLMQLSVCFFMSFFPLDVKDMPKGMKSTTYAQKFPSYPYSGNPEQQSNDASFRYEKSVKLFIKLPRIQACMIHMNDEWHLRRTGIVWIFKRLSLGYRCVTQTLPPVTDLFCQFSNVCRIFSGETAKDFWMGPMPFLNLRT